MLNFMLIVVYNFKHALADILIGKPKKKSRCGVRKPATLTILLRERTKKVYSPNYMLLFEVYISD